MTEQEFLASYSIENFQRPSLTVDIVTFALQREKQHASIKSVNVYGLQLLLIKRANYPFKDKWALPGGFCIPTEQVQMTAKRELQEETGIINNNLQLINVYSEINRDPRGWIISNVFRALIDKNQVNLRADTDAWEAQWFNVIINNNNITLENEKTLEQIIISDKTKSLAFDHDKIINNAILKLQKDIINNVTILFDFFDSKFTIGEIQTAYKVITNASTDNFRRKINDYIVETNEYSEIKGFRPAKLYKKR